MRFVSASRHEDLFRTHARIGRIAFDDGLWLGLGIAVEELRLGRHRLGLGRLVGVEPDFARHARGLHDAARGLVGRELLHVRPGQQARIGGGSFTKDGHDGSLLRLLDSVHAHENGVHVRVELFGVRKKRDGGAELLKPCGVIS